MIVRYRRANRSDISEIISVQRSDGFAHQYYLTPGRLRALFKREQFYVAVADGRIVGFGSLDCEIRAYVHFICVDQNHAGNGIGRQLMKRCLKYVGAAGCDRAYTFVEEHSAKEGFLAAMKFACVGFYRNRYGNGINATIWETNI